MDGRRLCRSRIEAVGSKRRTWELGGDGVLSSGAERREGADVACGTDAGDDAGQPNQYGRREELRASMRAQGGCPPWLRAPLRRLIHATKSREIPGWIRPAGEDRRGTIRG